MLVSRVGAVVATIDALLVWPGRSHCRSLGRLTTCLRLMLCVRPAEALGLLRVAHNACLLAGVESLIAPLVKTLAALVTRPEGAQCVAHVARCVIVVLTPRVSWCPGELDFEWRPPTVVMCHQTRSVASDTALFDALSDHFVVTEVRPPTRRWC